jgi:hypothetical protein
MNFISQLWTSFTGFLSHVFGSANAAAMLAWGKQFLTDEGAVIFADVAKYGAEIWAGTITITDAATSAWVDLKAKGIADGQQAIETVFNALRTHTNLAAMAATAAPVVDPANAAQPSI